jgi:RND superfamily putative drug exporter
MIPRFFESLGATVERHWRLCLVVWLVAMVWGFGTARGLFTEWGYPIPKFKDLIEDGEFAYLPQEMPSLVGERLMAKSFPHDLLNSSVVVVVRRETQPLVEQDDRFIQDVLRPRLEALQETSPELIVSVKTSRDPLMGKLLDSEDRKASLVIVALRSEFLDFGNKPTIEAIEKILNDVRKEVDPATAVPITPPGLELAISGTATVGRDMLVANQQSAHGTEAWTTALVVILLLAIYRAPLLALIPLITVFFAVNVSLGLVILLTQIPNWGFRIFWGMEVYITVVVYGAGVDYCLFLIARYKEELDRGLRIKQAIPETLGKVGAALIASAGTVIGGIGMLVFAQFGKFREAGIGISLSLVVVSIASITLTPALLRMTGRWAFWPYGRSEHLAGTGWLSGTSLVNRLIERNRVQIAWESIAKMVVSSPRTVLVVCIAAMLPFAVVGLVWHDYLSYGLLSELSPSNQSVIGAKAVQSHFPAGSAGPVTIILRNNQIDFRSEEGRAALDELASQLKANRQELGLADVRYVRFPLGWSQPGILHEGQATAEVDPTDRVKAAARGFRERVVDAQRRREADEYYISAEGEYDGHVSRLDLVFRDDPFSRECIAQLNAVTETLKRDMPLALKGESEIHLVGPTASIRDLKTVTDHDQIKIDILVLAVVFLILVALLRKPAVSAYLIVSVFFSYFVTLGATFVAFWWWYGADFAGLDWKVPMFLFTILIAIGEDYNIFLMTRIEEEQELHGAIEGIRIAVTKTGSIISSCGIIMAGTFFSLIMGGELVGMKQLGFALCFGVLLDTFVVRPLLVPAYLVLLHGGHFGSLGKYLGHSHPTSPRDLPATTLVP